MLAVNDNISSRNLQIAVWKMLRAGVPTQLISFTLGVPEGDLAELQATRTVAFNRPSKSL